MRSIDSCVLFNPSLDAIEWSCCHFDFNQASAKISFALQRIQDISVFPQLYFDRVLHAYSMGRVNHRCFRFVSHTVVKEGQTASRPMPFYIYQPVLLSCVGMGSFDTFYSRESLLKFIFQQGSSLARSHAHFITKPPIHCVISSHDQLIALFLCTLHRTNSKSFVYKQR